MEGGEGAVQPMEEVVEDEMEGKDVEEEDAKHEKQEQVDLVQEVEVEEEGPWGELADEVLVSIFKHLDPFNWNGREVGRAALTCASWARILLYDGSLWSHFHLVHIGPIPPMVVRELVEREKARRKGVVEEDERGKTLRYALRRKRRVVVLGNGKGYKGDGKGKGNKSEGKGKGKGNANDNKDGEDKKEEEEEEEKEMVDRFGTRVPWWAWKENFKRVMKSRRSFLLGRGNALVSIEGLAWSVECGFANAVGYIIDGMHDELERRVRGKAVTNPGARLRSSTQTFESVLYEAFVRAAKSGSLPIVELLCGLGWETDLINAGTYSYTPSPFLGAVEGGFEQVARFILEHQREKHTPAPDTWRKAFDSVARNGNANVVPMLLENGAPLPSEQVLYEAASKGNVGVVSALLPMFDSATIGAELMSRACASKSEAMVEYLLQSGLAIDPGWRLGFRPSGNDFGFIKYLHLKGLKFEQNTGHDVFQGKWGMEDYEVGKFLVDNGVNVNACNEYGRTALHEAVDASDLETVELLLILGADPKVKGSKAHAVNYTARQHSRNGILALISKPAKHWKQRADEENRKRKRSDETESKEAEEDTKEAKKKGKKTKKAKKEKEAPAKRRRSSRKKKDEEEEEEEEKDEKGKEVEVEKKDEKPTAAPTPAARPLSQRKQEEAQLKKDLLRWYPAGTANFRSRWFVKSELRKLGIQKASVPGALALLRLLRDTLVENEKGAQE